MSSFKRCSHLRTRITAVVLLFALILPSLYLPVTAEGSAMASVGDSAETVESSEQIFARITADNRVLDYVEESTFRCC